MSILIGHSSINELGKATGGLAGDQTGKEICTRLWYNPSSKWDYVLRPLTNEIAEKSAKFVEDICDNNKVGYNQSDRNSLYKQAKAVNFDGKKIKKACSCDCSSLMHTSAIAGGAAIPYGSNGLTTRTMVDGFRKSGDYTVLSDEKYLTSDKYLRRGDILVNEGSHTVMALEDGVEAYDMFEDKFEPYVAKVTTDLNLRNTPSSLYRTNVIVVLPKDTYVSVIDYSVGYWVKVQLVAYNQEYTGYVSSKYLEQVNISKNEKRHVTAHGLNARAGQGTTHHKIFTMKKNDVFTVVNKEKWGLILYDNKLGYANVSNAYSKKL